MIRVILPFHLRTLAHADAEVTFEVEGPVTQRSVLDASLVRKANPAIPCCFCLRGTIFRASQ
jgi:hypothetical protein